MNPKTPLSHTRFVETYAASRYKIKLPHWLAAWECWPNWESERFSSMGALLKKGDVLFDIGTESASCSVIYAQFVGPENMCLFEGLPDWWPNIKATWEANELVAPKSALCTLVSDKTIIPSGVDFTLGNRGPWPEPAYDQNLLDAYRCRYIWEHANRTPQITVDDFVNQTGIIPTAFTIDVEGAEGNVLRGARETLQKYHPKIWASLHPELETRWKEWDFTFDIRYVHSLLNEIGYKGQHLATDHEEHWLFT